jgi:hypothetical protein
MQFSENAGEALRVQRKDDLLADKEDELARLRGQVARRDALLEEKEGELARLRASENKHMTEMYADEQLIAQQDAELAELRLHASRHMDDSHEDDLLIAQKDEALRLLSLEVVELRLALAAATRVTASKRTWISQQDVQIVELKKQNADLYQALDAESDSSSESAGAEGARGEGDGVDEAGTGDSAEASEGDKAVDELPEPDSSSDEEEGAGDER